MSEWFVTGEPAVWMGSGEKNWKLRMAETVSLGTPSPPAFFELDFRVSSLLRAGHPFDLDNMVTPVFASVLGPRHSSWRRALTSWRAFRKVDPNPGLHFRCLDKPRATFPPNGAVVVLDATLRGCLPKDSRGGGEAFVTGIGDALEAWTPEKTHRFAVALEFGEDVGDITWVEEAPIKPVVDCLFPVFGGPPGAPNDWKVDAIHVRRGRPDLRGGCSVKIWLIPGSGGSTPSPIPARREIVMPDPQKSASPPLMRRSGMTHFDCLDEAAKALGSPPAGLRINDLLTRASTLFSTMAAVSKDSASATMDYQTINIRGRANQPGDFTSRDRWNTYPAFVKVQRGVWRRLSDEERIAFAKLWASSEPLLRQESYDASEWDALFRRSS